MSNGQSTKYGPGTVKRAFGTAALSGDNLIAAGVTGKRLRVLAFTLASPSSLTTGFEDNDGAIGGLYSFNNNNLAVPYLEVGWVETKVGGRLDLNNSGALPIFYTILYVEVP